MQKTTVLMKKSKGYTLTWVRWNELSNANSSKSRLWVKNMAFISDVYNLMCHFGALTKCKQFGSFAYRRLFPERLRIASFASDLVFRPPSKNMGLNRRRFLNYLCHRLLEEPPRDCHFITIHRFANYTWQKQPFWPEIAHFLTWSFHKFHTRNFQTRHVNFSNFTCELLKVLTSRRQNRRKKCSFSTLFTVCNFWHFDGFLCIFAYIMTKKTPTLKND